MKNIVMSISDFAKFKSTSRQSVYNNLSKFTLDDSYGTQRIVVDEKAEEWEPKKQYKPKKIKE
ncbi:hypothetical protein [Wohlfahrtiimonas chitiniclastica]|uniref:hypothetical protein n=1 Tax=Wohlfahrtiimonas chitiniclastica TaxID=400946 RepID=UPI0007B697EF|nr:hypothetical protein [Wohlfahrtiimonas chitiniclastica]KZX37251.1 hypothetical protein A6V30_10220 [Wohlfahrtiimonas chitiniclastica]KZX37271.1 hypothetical protein A6V30_10325 [Wohlfahrtiimonas chitiniclastica]